MLLIAGGFVFSHSNAPPGRRGVASLPARQGTGRLKHRRRNAGPSEMWVVVLVPVLHRRTTVMLRHYTSSASNLIVDHADQGMLMSHRCRCPVGLSMTRTRTMPYRVTGWRERIQALGGMRARARRRLSLSCVYAVPRRSLPFPAASLGPNIRRGDTHLLVRLMVAGPGRGGGHGPAVPAWPAGEEPAPSSVTSPRRPVAVPCPAAPRSAAPPPGLFRWSASGTGPQTDISWPRKRLSGRT